MKIVLLTGSPHRHGASNMLADRFAEGAQEAGHEVYRFDCASASVHPCIGCDSCRKEDSKGCVFRDDMPELNPKLLEADAIVFASPIYYFGLSAQIKTVIDRFYANNTALMGGKKCALLLAAGDPYEHNMEGARLTFELMAHYLQWDIVDMVFGDGCYTPQDMAATGYPNHAYQLGLRF